MRPMFFPGVDNARRRHRNGCDRRIHRNGRRIWSPARRRWRPDAMSSARQHRAAFAQVDVHVERVLQRVRRLPAVAQGVAIVVA